MCPVGQASGLVDAMTQQYHVRPRFLQHPYSGVHSTEANFPQGHELVLSRDWSQSFPAHMQQEKDTWFSFPESSGISHLVSHWSKRACPQIDP